jgi:hypothetical protein
MKRETGEGNEEKGLEEGMRRKQMRWRERMKRRKLKKIEEEWRWEDKGGET